MPSKNKTKNFLVVWDMLGLESIWDIDEAQNEIDEWEKKKIWNTLKEAPIEKKPNPIPLQMLLMRARINTHRSYEIYTFPSSMSINEVRKEFNRDPQPIVDWIRKNGNKIYSDYSKSKNKVIF